MDKSVNDVIVQYAQQVKKAYNPKCIYLYGSHAKGTANTESDIDIAVILNATDMSRYLDVFGKLFSIAADIDHRIEPNLLMDDGVDDKYSLLYEIKKTGRLITGAPS